LYHIGDLYWVAKLGNVFCLGTSIICIIVGTGVKPACWCERHTRALKLK
jgi:hypothetical protein